MTTEVGLPALEGLAYSQDRTAAAAVAPSVVARYGWGWVFDRAALFLLLATLLASGIVVVGYMPGAAQQQQLPPEVSPSVTGPADIPAAYPPLVVPPDAAHRLSGDDWYLAMANDGLAAVDMSVSNPAGSVSDAHRICDYIAAGHTVGQTVDEIVSGLPDTMPPAQARTVATAVASAAVKAYCPIGAQP